jgi:enoyl-CoA hydratase/3-hydroxyacyl-CoA dehydrogenase
MIASACNAAIWLLDNDVASKADIDTAMENGMSWPRGVFAMADRYGLDRIVGTLEDRHAATGWEQYVPHGRLESMVAAGTLGRSSGKGFYEYDYNRERFGPFEYEFRSDLAYISAVPRETGMHPDEAYWQGLRDALQTAADTDAVRATVLCDVVERFNPEVALSELLDNAGPAESEAVLSSAVRPTLDALHSHPVPTVVVIDGEIEGPGCELVLLSDMAIGTPETSFCLPEASIGVVPPVWLTHGPAGIDYKKGLELAVTGCAIAATEAETMGLVNYVVSAGQAPDVARELAQAITENASASVRAITDAWEPRASGAGESVGDAALTSFIELAHTKEHHDHLESYLNGNGDQ